MKKTDDQEKARFRFRWGPFLNGKPSFFDKSDSNILC